MESSSYGKFELWKVRVMESSSYGNFELWKVRVMESSSYGKFELWMFHCVYTAENQAFPMTELLFGVFMDAKLRYQLQKIHGMCNPQLSSTGTNIIRVWYKIS